MNSLPWIPQQLSILKTITLNPKNLIPNPQTPKPHTPKWPKPLIWLLSTLDTWVLFFFFESEFLFHKHDTSQRCSHLLAL